MKSIPLAKDIMTCNVFTMHQNHTLHIAKEIMDWKHIRHIPVVNSKNALVGLITHRDLLKASISTITTSIANVERKQHLWSIPVANVMNFLVRTVGPEEPVTEMARIMRKEKIGCLPVVDENEKLLGIVTEADLLGVLEQLG